MRKETVVVLDRIGTALREKWDLHWANFVDKMCDNIGPDVMSFAWDGHFYSRKGSIRRGIKLERHPLPKHLWEEMASHQTNQLKTIRDLNKINQFLILLVQHANDLNEVRDLLPECLWPLAGFEGQQRCYNMFFAHNGPHRQHLEMQYERLLPLIEYYLGMRAVL